MSQPTIEKTWVLMFDGTEIDPKLYKAVYNRNDEIGKVNVGFRKNITIGIPRTVNKIKYGKYYVYLVDKNLNLATNFDQLTSQWQGVDWTQLRTVGETDITLIEELLLKLTAVGEKKYWDAMSAYSPSLMLVLAIMGSGIAIGAIITFLIQKIG